MSRPRRSAARAGVIAALFSGVLVANVALGGCTPGPAPKPTPTPMFTSEADAFKAAEKVYRDYVDATNARRAGDSKLNPQDLLAGQALEDDIRSQRKFQAKHVRIVGDNVLAQFVGSKYQPVPGRIDADVCVDVSQSRVLDESGVDVTPTDRKNLVSVLVGMTRLGEDLKITSSEPGQRSCAG